MKGSIMTKPITLVQDDAPEITELKKSRKKIYIITTASFAALATVAVAAYVIRKQELEDCEFQEGVIDGLEDLVAAFDTPTE
jgi:hypothetical protein